jgi:hypothetical protein
MREMGVVRVWKGRRSSLSDFNLAPLLASCLD